MKKATTMTELATAIAADQKTVLLFTADWCGDCQFIYPVLSEIEEALPSLTFYQVDRDDFMDVAKEWDIFGIPSLVVTQKGQELGRLVNRARKTKEELIAFLSAYAD